MKLPEKPTGEKIIVGWREMAGLPDLGVEGIRAKVDTGARTSSIHAEDVELFDRDGEHWVRFLLPQDGARAPIACEAPHVEHRTITSSTGHQDERLVIKTHLALGGQTFPVEISLADRSDMGFPMLIGRTALRRRFLVNPARSFMLTKPRRKSVTS